MKKLLPLIFISAGIVGLSSCGQTGDLYLPKEKIPLSSKSKTTSNSKTNNKQNNADDQNSTSAQSAQS
ncbi:LPS translocon maturation chaperone LptM, partial [Francisella sp. SYW-9]|uniref:LPS translocon maturation chaperone LptM n=1 Tax=Francisella sp. SYW-9 TaxID=2610888 RepID=UPI00123D89F0